MSRARFKRTYCPYDGKPCKQADRCTLRLLDACANCTDDFAAVNCSAAVTCAVCRKIRAKKYAARHRYHDAPCDKEFLCIIRDADQIPDDEE